tara:strand:+ start:723 stop:1334 length:612 start_codon:yes stop_codon:yes gene_type:complete
MSKIYKLYAFLILFASMLLTACNNKMNDDLQEDLAAIAADAIPAGAIGQDAYNEFYEKVESNLDILKDFSEKQANNNGAPPEIPDPKIAIALAEVNTFLVITSEINIAEIVEDRKKVLEMHTNVVKMYTDQVIGLIDVELANCKSLQHLREVEQKYSTDPKYQYKEIQDKLKQKITDYTPTCERNDEGDHGLPAPPSLPASGN